MLKSFQKCSKVSHQVSFSVNWRFGDERQGVVHTDKKISGVLSLQVLDKMNSYTYSSQLHVASL